MMTKRPWKYGLKNMIEIAINGAIEDGLTTGFLLCESKDGYIDWVKDETTEGEAHPICSRSTETIASIVVTPKRTRR